MQLVVNHNYIELPNFKEKNFACRCGCGLNNMKDMFLWKLQMARTEARVPFVITSGSRCAKHNKDVGGTEESDHLTGEAVDIECPDSHTRWRIVFAAMNCGFRRIGLGEDFVHIGDKWTNPQEVLWLYPIVKS